MSGFYEQEHVGTIIEHLAYKVPVETVVNGLECQATAVCVVNFGTDAILEAQRNQSGDASALLGIIESGKTVFDLNPRERRAVNSLIQGQHGPITRAPEYLTIQLTDDAALRHAENTFAEQRVLEERYGKFKYWLDRHNGLRPKEPISNIFRLTSVGARYNGSIIGLRELLIDGANKVPQELWEFSLNYYWRTIYIDHHFQTGVASQQEASIFINQHEAIDVDRRVAIFLGALSEISDGIFSFPSLLPLLEY